MNINRETEETESALSEQELRKQQNSFHFVIDHGSSKIVFFFLLLVC